jgi:CRISPR-associated exonuclease Cas4
MGTGCAGPIPLSALQHYAFCPRQCALIHLDRVWEENLYTLRGKRLHERSDQPEAIVRDGMRVEYALPLWSEQYGLIGKADVVEFDEHDRPYPVEYKSGRRKHRLADRVQLTGQALCLEEMFDCTITEGAIFYYRSRRREIVPIDTELREETVRVITAVRELLSGKALPPPCEDTRCRLCSLQDECLPTLRTLVTEVE